jgi:O-acetylserine/cysteine efflux transporter
MTLRDFSLMFVVCFGWAAHTIISKIVVSEMGIPPLFYAAVRYGLVALVALPWLLPVPKPAWRILLVGFLMGGGGFSLFFLGIKTSSPSSAAIVQQLGLPITALLSVMMLGERIRLQRGLGIALTFLGVVIVMWEPGGFSLSGGLTLIVGSAFAGSLAAVMMKQIAGVRVIRIQAWVGLASVAPLCLLSAAVESSQFELALRAGWPFAAAVLFSAFFVSLVTHTIYYRLILKYPASLIAPLMLMTPLMTVVLGIIVTGDRFDLRMWFGTALVLCGVLVITVAPKSVTPLAARLRDRFRR